MKRKGKRARLRATLDQLELRTRMQSPFWEENLLAVQRECCLYCDRNKAKYSTDIDWRRCVATVTVERKGSDPMQDWDFLRAVERYVLRIDRDVRVRSYEATFRVIFFVKFFP